LQKFFVFFYFVLCLYIKLWDFELICILIQLYWVLITSQHSVRCGNRKPLIDLFLFWKSVYVTINVLMLVYWCINWLDSHSFYLFWWKVAIIELLIYIHIIYLRVLEWLLEWTLRVLVVHAISVVFETLAVWCHLGFTLTVRFSLLILVLLYLSIFNHVFMFLLINFFQKTLCICFFFYDLALLV
jgi:hypothetical protein